MEVESARTPDKCLRQARYKSGVFKGSFVQPLYAQRKKPSISVAAVYQPVQTVSIRGQKT